MAVPATLHCSHSAAGGSLQLAAQRHATQITHGISNTPHFVNKCIGSNNTTARYGATRRGLAPVVSQI